MTPSHYSRHSFAILPAFLMGCIGRVCSRDCGFHPRLTMVYNTVWLPCNHSFIMEANIKSLHLTTVVGTFDTPSYCAVKLVVASQIKQLTVTDNIIVTGFAKTHHFMHF